MLDNKYININNNNSNNNNNNNNNNVIINNNNKNISLKILTIFEKKLTKVI